MDYLGQSDKVKIKVYERIIRHLFKACEDKRHREQLRAKVALKNIKNWILEEGGK